MNNSELTKESNSFEDLINNVNKAAAQFVLLSNVDKEETEEKVSNILDQLQDTLKNLVEHSKKLNNHARANGDLSDEILYATEQLLESSDTLMKGMNPELEKTKDTRSEVNSKAQAVGDSASALLNLAVPDREISGRTELLMDTSKKVTAAQGAFVKKAKEIAKGLSKPEDFVKPTMSCVLSTGDMLTITKLLANNIDNEESKEIIMEGLNNIDKNIQNCINIANSLDDVSDEHKTYLNDSSKNIKKLLNTMRNLIYHEENLNDILFEMTKENDAIISSSDSEKIIQNVKQLSATSSELINNLEKEAENITNDACKMFMKEKIEEIADASSKVLTHATAYAKNPSKENHENLVAATNQLESLSSNVVNFTNQMKIFAKLAEVAAEANEKVGIYEKELQEQILSKNGDNSKLLELRRALTRMKDMSDSLKQTLTTAQNHPSVSSAQVNLMKTSRDFITPALDLLKTGKSASSGLQDKQVKSQLQSASSAFKSALKDLIEHMKIVEAVGGSMKIDATRELVKNLNSEIDDLQTMISGLDFKPNQTKEATASLSKLIAAKNCVEEKLKKIEELIEKGEVNEVQTMIAELGDDFASLVDAVKDYAMSSDNKEDSLNLISSARKIVANFDRYLSTVSTLRTDDENNMERSASIKHAETDLHQSLIQMKDLSSDLAKKGAVDDSKLSKLSDQIKKILESISNNEKIDQRMVKLLLDTGFDVAKELKEKIQASSDEREKAELTRMLATLEGYLRKVGKKSASDGVSKEELLEAGNSIEQGLKKVSSLNYIQQFVEAATKSSQISEKLVGEIIDNISPAEDHVKKAQMTSHLLESTKGLTQSLISHSEQPGSYLAFYNVLEESKNFLDASKSVRKQPKNAFSVNILETMDGFEKAIDDMVFRMQKVQEFSIDNKQEAADELLQKLLTQAKTKTLIQNKNDESMSKEAATESVVTSLNAVQNSLRNLTHTVQTGDKSLTGDNLFNMMSSIQKYGDALRALKDSDTMRKEYGELLSQVAKLNSKTKEFMEGGNVEDEIIQTVAMIKATVNSLPLQLADADNKEVIYKSVVKNLNLDLTQTGNEKVSKERSDEMMKEHLTDILSASDSEYFNGLNRFVTMSLPHSDRDHLQLETKYLLKLSEALSEASDPEEVRNIKSSINSTVILMSAPGTVSLNKINSIKTDLSSLLTSDTRDVKKTSVERLVRSLEEVVSEASRSPNFIYIKVFKKYISNILFQMKF